MADLSGVYAKLARADDHLSALDASIGLWGKQCPYAVSGHHNPDKTEHRFYVTIKASPDLVRWGAMIGDCAHNLRGALDHLAWQCCLPASDKKTEFPIFISPRGFETGGVRKIRGCEDPDVRALFERRQPFNTQPKSPENDHLWVVHELDRVDKHQVLTPILVVPRALDVRFEIEYPTAEMTDEASPPLIVANGGPIEDGTEVFALYLTHPPTKVKMKGGFTLGVAIRQGASEGGVTGTLRELCKYTRGVVEEFANVLV